MSNIQVGSNMPVASSLNTIEATQNLGLNPQANGVQFGLNTDWSLVWKGNGIVRLNVNLPIVHAGSTVLVSLSEFSDINNPAGSRFIGGARFAIYNIAPREGGVDIWAEVSWANPINIYFSFLVN
jgi:hypothetical protein